MAPLPRALDEVPVENSIPAAVAVVSSAMLTIWMGKVSAAASVCEVTRWPGDVVPNPTLPALRYSVFATAPAVTLVNGITEFCVIVTAVASSLMVLTVGELPAPPPRIAKYCVSAPELAHVDALEKYGMPPEVPATVNAGVVVPVATVTSPPVHPTEVTYARAGTHAIPVDTMS